MRRPEPVCARSTALAALLLLRGACDFYYYTVPSPDDLWHIIPWFDHMITARYVRPYETGGGAALHAGGHRARERR